jgi:hypothetical protein
MQTEAELPIITTDTGIKIYPIQTHDEIHRAFANKLSANYGLTGGGKSYVSETIIEGLSTLIPKFLFYSATENANGAYKKIAPSPCVFNTFDVNKFQKDMGYQDAMSAIWRAGIDIQHLDGMYNKLTRDRKELDSILRQLDVANTTGDDKTKKMIEATKVQVYQHFISQLNLSNLSPDDQKIVKRFNINPCVCIIVDDFAAELEAASKSKNGGKEFFRSLSYNTRHYNATWIFMLQNTDAMDAKMRSNTQTCIFVSPTELRKYFKNRTNSFSAADIKESEQVADKLEALQGHRVAVFCRDGTYDHKWNYMIGKANAKPEPGSKPLRYLMTQCEKERAATLLAQDNAFSSLL